MEIIIIIDTTLSPQSGKISLQTIRNINKFKKYKIAVEYGYFQVGDIFGDSNFLVEVVQNELLKKDILYVSKDVKKQFYPNKSILSIQ